MKLPHSVSQRTLGLTLALAVLAGLAFATSYFVAGRRGGTGGEEPRTATFGWEADQRIRVQVLNGAGRAGLARQATERLRDRGFDVVYFGNASEFGWDSSVVLDRLGKGTAARAVADALGITRVQESPDSTLLVDVTVILGGDWPPQP